MSATVIEFKSVTRPIAHFIRVDDAHRRLGELHAAERLARSIKDLKPSTKDAEDLGVNVESLLKRMGEDHRKLGKFSDALFPLHDERGRSAPRVGFCERRVNVDGSSVGGRGA